MFHVMWNSNYSETTSLRELTNELKRRLPRDWSSSITNENCQYPLNTRIDAILEVIAPDGTKAKILIEAKQKTPETRDIIAQARYWRQVLSECGLDEANNETSIMVLAPYLGQTAQNELAEEGISFADMTGNIRFVLNRPAVFIEAKGAKRNPLRERIPLKSLRGRGTGRVVRGLLDYAPPFGIRELSKVINSSISSISRVLELLEREAIINRDSPRGQVLTVKWEKLLRRWTEDYDFMQTNNMTTYLAPRGVQEVLSNLNTGKFKYAITGSFAAKRYAPIAQAKLISIYVENLEIAVEMLDLRRAETGGNVLLGKPFNPVVFERIEDFEGLTYAKISQIAADLLTGPGRNPTEGEAMVSWMRDNEGKWRYKLTQNI